MLHYSRQYYMPCYSIFTCIPLLLVLFIAYWALCCITSKSINSIKVNYYNSTTLPTRLWHWQLRTISGSIYENYLGWNLKQQRKALWIVVGRVSSVGTATGYRLDYQVIESRRGGGGGEIFRTRPDRPWDPPSLLYDEYRVFFPGVKRPGLALTTHPI
jgi:hypothetical protein